MHSFIVIIAVLIALVACTQASQGSLRDLKKNKHGKKKIKKEKKIKKKDNNMYIEIKNEEADVQNLNEKKDKKKDNDDIEIKNEETAVQTLNEDECSSEYIPSKCECSKGPTCWNRIANSNEHETKCSQCPCTSPRDCSRTWCVVNPLCDTTIDDGINGVRYLNAWKVNTNKFGNYYYPTGLNSTANKFLIKETKKDIGVMETRKIKEPTTGTMISTINLMIIGTMHIIPHMTNVKLVGLKF